MIPYCSPSFCANEPLALKHLLEAIAQAALPTLGMWATKAIFGFRFL
jgi:hypothetical protein